MTNKAPGKHYRKGVSYKQFFQLFPDDATAEAWFVQHRWEDGIRCPRCGHGSIQVGTSHKTMPLRCRQSKQGGCGRFFSVKTGTFMEASNLAYQDWLFALFLVATHRKSVSSRKLHRDIPVTQRTAWHMAHRIRKALGTGDGNLFEGPVEVDETYMGGKRRNMSSSQRKELTGRGPVGKTAVVGARDRSTKQVAAKVVTSTDKETLQGFVQDHAAEGSTVCTDEARAYKTLPFDHDSVQHSLQEYVKGEVHTNGTSKPDLVVPVDKRAHKGTFHKLSPQHLQRYVDEFAGRHNVRDLDTLEQMASIASATSTGASIGEQSQLSLQGLGPSERIGVRGADDRLNAPSRTAINDGMPLRASQQGKRASPACRDAPAPTSRGSAPLGSPRQCAAGPLPPENETSDSQRRAVRRYAADEVLCLNGQGRRSPAP